MAGDDLALVRRHLGDLAAHPAVELGEPPVVRRSALAIIISVGGIVGDEPLGDVGDVAPRPRHILPTMRVRTLRMTPHCLEGRHTACRHDRLAAKGCRLRQPVHPPFEAQSVAHQRAGARKRARVGGLGLVGVGVGVGADQHGEIDSVARDLEDEAAQDGESRDDPRPRLGEGRQRGDSHHRAEQMPADKHVMM
jgi:hypothetical protein